MATHRARRSEIKGSGGGGGKLRNADPKGTKKEEKRKSVDGEDEDESKKRKRMKECDGESEVHVEIERNSNRGEDGDEGGDGERPKPVGASIDSDGKVKWYSAFEYDGRRYQLEDSVLVTPEENKKPSIGIIKEISEAGNGGLSVTLQWFYRPEDLKKVYKDSWISLDNRELLMTNDKDEVPAQTIMHTCIVHYLSDRKKLPDRKKHPGFVVLHFYDHFKQKVYNIGDGDYINSLQAEIHQHIRETQSRIGLEDIPTNN